MIVAVAHQKGGVGKSTIVWNLATHLSKTKNVEIVDIDIQKTLTYTNELRKNQTNLKPMIVRNFDNADDFKKYIEDDSDDKISFIDLGGFDSAMNRLALITADLIITPVSHKNFELLGLKNFEKVLKDLSDLTKSNICVKILFNNIPAQKTKLDELKEYINKSNHFEIMKTILHSRADYDRSAGVGQNVIEYSPKEKASNELKELTKELLLMLKKH
jgi:chromosome partitioning protein